MKPQVTQIHLQWHGWELKSIPKEELRTHTARWFLEVMRRRYPDCTGRTYISFDDVPVKGAQLTIDTNMHGEEAERVRQEAYTVIYRTVKLMMDCYIAADAKRRPMVMTVPRADQLRWGTLN